MFQLSRTYGSPGITLVQFLRPKAVTAFSAS